MSAFRANSLLSAQWRKGTRALVSWDRDTIDEARRVMLMGKGAERMEPWRGLEVEEHTGTHECQ